MEQSYEQWLEETKNLNLDLKSLYDLVRKLKIGFLMNIPSSNEYDGPDLYMSKTHGLQEMWDRNTFDKKDLRVLIADGTRSEEYIEFLSKRFNVTVVKNGDETDLVLFTGGEDVNPKYYNEEKGKYTSFNNRRDELEKEVYSNYMYTPKLGICRGNQFLTVMQGGKLVQHLDGHGTSHDIIFRDNKIFTVTSTHHQMAYPFNLSEQTYKILGYSKYFKSGTYLNGNNQEIDLPKNFVEVEIVKYRNVLGIQGHPEYYNASKEFTNTSLKLIDELVFENEKFNKEINQQKEELEYGEA